MTYTEKKPNFILIMLVYLLGIFMGAIDTGIVTPARTIIQNHLGVNEQTGIWLITIYTLAYAASIPVMGKLADRFGRKYIYLLSVLLFGVGSLFCGLSQSFGSFNVLLVARVVQAIGGGGIIPVATAEFGTSFPEEKRGMALGLVGGVFGIANIFGASAGSLILDIFGIDNWSFIFYVNIPITLFIVVAGILTLGNSKTTNTNRIDIGGILTLTVMVLSLLYGIKNIDFFEMGSSIQSTKVYPFLIIFVVLIPLFILIEKRVKDPVINLKYFTNKNILVTLVISFISGFVMMGMIFVPQFSENALKIASGSGGYLVIILGLFAGIGAPLSGKLIDKFGAKLILGFGFAVSVLGCLFLMFVAIKNPNFITVFISLLLMGTGMGFTIGTPLNYMMLANTDEKESTSSLATLSLIRSIGTTIAPAIMVGFLAHAGMSVQPAIMDLLPKDVSVPQLPYAQEISDTVKKLKENPQMKDKLSSVELPDFSTMTKVQINMSSNSGYKLSPSLIELMQSSDVTTVTANSKTLASSMFSEMTPAIVKNIQDGVSKGIEGIDSGISQMETSVAGMQKGLEGLNAGIDQMTRASAAQESAMKKLPVGQADGQISELKAKIAASEKSKQEMEGAIAGIKSTIAQMKDLSSKMSTLKAAVPDAFETAKNNYLKEIDSKQPELEKIFQTTLNEGFRNVYLTSVLAAAAALLLLAFYSKKNEIAHKS